MAQVSALCVPGAKIVELCEQGDKLIEEEIERVYRGKKVAKGTICHDPSLVRSCRPCFHDRAWLGRGPD